MTAQTVNKKFNSVLIEISGKCQAQCPYCARADFQQRYSGETMSSAMFEKIINHIFDLDIFAKHVNSVGLFNWGEPFLNPQLNEILLLLKKKNLYAGISSNFIKKPQIETELLSVIRSVTFSISGFTQESYGRIHGASIEKVLKNFEDFYAKLRKYSPATFINIAWHRYKFNENEFWDAYRYFKRPGIYFAPTVAFFNNQNEFFNFSMGKLPENRLKEAEQDIHLSHLQQALESNKKKSASYRCFLHDQLVIDETGQMLLCCATHREFSALPVLGNVLTMSANEIWRKNQPNSFCKKCVSSGVPRYLNNIRKYDKRWPPNGGIDRLVLWYSHKHPVSWIRSNISSAMKKALPNGDRIVEKLKALEYKIVNKWQ
jgi:MoaA/NifB/PqqE/SkfB family radical SAM enzyme